MCVITNLVRRQTFQPQTLNNQALQVFSQSLAIEHGQPASEADDAVPTIRSDRIWGIATPQFYAP
jgi:hypothetical protein